MNRVYKFLGYYIKTVSYLKEVRKMNSHVGFQNSGGQLPKNLIQGLNYQIHEVELASIQKSLKKDTRTICNLIRIVL